jgi:hypothetical protein
MTAPASRASIFAERSRARALARDAKRARLSWWPGKWFKMSALPPYLELTREPGGWSMRRYEPPRRPR